MSNALKVIQESWNGCTKCGLGKDRQGPDIVFGIGRSTARFLLIYDVPTEGDEVARAPLTGREGTLLVQLLERAKIEIADVYYTPMLGCRPTVFLPATAESEARIADRSPKMEEVQACFTRVQQIIYALDPELIFTLGDLPFKMLVRPKDRGTFTTVEKAMGELFVSRLPGRMISEIKYDVMPLLSMKQILSSPSSAAHGPLNTTARYLHKGAVYAQFAKATRERDTRALGAPQPGVTQGET